ncbi:40S ribosomal protein S29 [Trichonephila inaurata madagascariensis]|uniref:Small ribosomal subunit protein uS14 n=1 Tax=Trichonephila inaurata madagascariensis TaxID=2747483 RepID=A0A8X6YV87_9ARAC|nr:40S ribosomal protein S29 [Trichonephila inaurata madagascariensis]
MGHKNLWFSHPRKFGPGSRTCRVCSNHHGLIRKYGLNMCRRCFRENAADIGFKKVFIKGLKYITTFVKVTTHNVQK